MNSERADPTDAADASASEATVTVQDLQTRAVRGSLWTILHVAISTPVAVAANALVARSLGVVNYGSLAVLTLAAALALSISDLGVTEATVQWGAAAHSKGNRQFVAELLQKALGFHLLVQLPVVAVVLAVVARGENLPLLGALLGGTMISVCLSSVGLAIGIENKTAGAAKVAIVNNLVIQAAVSMVAVLSKSPILVWATRSVAANALFPAYLILLPPRMRRIVVCPAWPNRLPPGFWRFAILTSLGGLLSLLVFSRTELLVLDWAGAAAAAGLFALAFGLSAQISAPIDALLGPLNPAIAGIVATRPDLIHRTMVRVTRLSGLLGAAVVLALPLVYAVIPVLYGSQYRGAALAFVVLGASSCLQSTINPLLAFNRARHASHAMLGIYGAALVANVGPALMLIPRYGLWGAVVANTCGQIVVVGGLLRAESRAWAVQTRELIRILVPFAASALFVILGAFLVNDRVSPSIGGPGVCLVAAALVWGLMKACRLEIPEADLYAAVSTLPNRLRTAVVQMAQRIKVVR
jgi:O-antigen/teichoic acid export membrane protein